MQRLLWLTCVAGFRNAILCDGNSVFILTMPTISSTRPLSRLFSLQYCAQGARRRCSGYVKDRGKGRLEGHYP
jgi:hypothetical protein